MSNKAHMCIVELENHRAALITMYERHIVKEEETAKALEQEATFMLHVLRAALHKLYAGKKNPSEVEDWVATSEKWSRTFSK